MAPFYLGIESVLILYFIYTSRMPFNLWICTTDGAKEHECIIVMFNMAAFVAVNIKGLVHVSTYDRLQIYAKIARFLHRQNKKSRLPKLSVITVLMHNYS